MGRSKHSAESFTNSKRKRVKSSKQRPPWLTALLYFFVFSLAAISIYTVLSSRSSESSEVQDDSPASSGPAIAELLDPETFRAEYIKANGGREYLKGLQSLRFRGSITSGEDHYGFSILKSRPDKMRLTYQRGTSELTYFFNGDEQQMRRSRPGAPDEVGEIPSETAADFEDYVPMFDSTLIACLDEAGGDMKIEEAEFEGRPVIAVILQAADKAKREQVFVDPETLNIIAMESKSANGVLQVTQYDDYRMVGKLNVPYQQITLVEGKEKSRVQLASVAINVGTSSWMFEL